MKVMKNMKNILKSVFVLLLITTFASCGNMFSDKDSVKKETDNKTVLKVSVENNLSARTVFPDSSLGFLSNFVLEGKKTSTTKPPVELATAENISELNALTVVFEDKDVGEWDFILTGQYTIGTEDNEKTLFFKAEQTAEIKKNQMNSVSFLLRNEDFPYGGLNFTVQFTDETNSVFEVEANIKNYDWSISENMEFTTEDIKQTSTQGVKKFTIIKDLSDSSDGALARLPAGSYYLELNFYTSEGVKLNSLPYAVQIVNGLTTTATVNVAVNQMYALNYEFYLNGTKLSVKDGQLLPDNVQIKNGGVLPGKYTTRFSTPLPDLAMEGYGFSGWYDSASGGHVVTDASATGSYAPRTIYARFFTAEYTVGSGGDYDSITAALEQIRNYATNTNRTNIDWTIKVIGTLTGCQQIDNMAIDGFAGSIFVTGNTIPEPGENPTDIINANLSDPTYYGAALIITASTPVTIKNIKITGGNNDNSDSYVKGGGLYIGPGTEVTLGDGVLITGNSASQGSGIYTVDDFNMQGSACVSSDNEIYLGKESPSSDSSKITVTGHLTASKSATIVPYSYEADFRVLYSGLGLNLKNEYEQFDITQQQGSTKDWKLKPNGLITYYDYSEDGHDYVDFGLPSGTLWSTMNYGQTESRPGDNTEWHTFYYGNTYSGKDPAWGEEWSIASTAEWQELISECYWMDIGQISLGNYNPSHAYYVFKAKDESHKGKAYDFDDQYDASTDDYIMIIRRVSNQPCYYWPQIFVDETWLNKGASNYTPKPPCIDFSNSLQPKVNDTWTTAPSTAYCRLVISKKRTLVVTPNGDDSHSGRNASTSYRNEQPLKTIQGAINKIAAVGDDTIDWNIVVFGELTGAQTINSITADQAKSITIYGGNGLYANEEPQDTLNGGFTSSNHGTTLTISGTGDLPIILKNIKITGGNTIGYGGGLNIGTGTNVLLSDGVLVTGNSAGDNGYGGAVYVSSDTNLKMEGSAYIAASSGAGDNDIYLGGLGAKILVMSTLTKTAPIATITPSIYTSAKVIDCSSDSTATLSEESTKFNVTPDGSDNWSISERGILKIDLSTFIDSITGLTESGTITAPSAVVDNSDLVAISTALDTLYGTKPTVEVILDLSGFTGIATVTQYPSGKETLFDNNQNLKEITLPSSLTSIDKLFSNCSKLETINMPDSITAVGATPFNNCSALKFVTINGTEENATLGSNYKLVNKGLYDGNTLVSYYGKAITSDPTFAEGITTIYENAFSSCSFSNVEIPDTVDSLPNGVFRNNTHITFIIFSTDIDIESIPEEMCKGCTSLTSITIPDGCISIGNSAFYGCNTMTQINLPRSIQEIGENAFNGCNSLNIVRYEGSEAQKGEIQIGEGNTPLVNITWTCTGN